MIVTIFVKSMFQTKKPYDNFFEIIVVVVVIAVGCYSGFLFGRPLCFLCNAEFRGIPRTQSVRVVSGLKAGKHFRLHYYVPPPPLRLRPRTDNAT